MAIGDSLRTGDQRDERQRSDIVTWSHHPQSEMVYHRRASNLSQNQVVNPLTVAA